MKKLLFFFSFMMIVTSCGIEGIEPLRELNPPLGLTASMSSNNILLRFYSSNPEDYFTGFNIYIAKNEEDLRNGSGTRMPNTDYDNTKPTLWQDIAPSSNIIIYQIVFTKNYDLQVFQPGLDYFFYVKAFSQEYNISSPPSNITNVTFLIN